MKKILCAILLFVLFIGLAGCDVFSQLESIGLNDNTNTQEDNKEDNNQSNDNQNEGNNNQSSDNNQNEENKPTTEYVVTFNSNGGSSVASQTVTENSKVNKPTDPTKEGYSFDGWYFNESEWDFTNNVVEGDITLLAKWAYNEVGKQVIFSDVPIVELTIGDYLDLLYGIKAIDKDGTDLINDLIVNSEVPVDEKGRVIEEGTFRVEYKIKIDLNEYSLVRIVVVSAAHTGSYFECSGVDLTGGTINPNCTDVERQIRITKTGEATMAWVGINADADYTGYNKVSGTIQGPIGGSVLIRVNAQESSELLITTDGELMPFEVSLAEGAVWNNNNFPVQIFVDPGKAGTSQEYIFKSLEVSGEGKDSVDLISGFITNSHVACKVARDLILSKPTDITSEWDAVIINHLENDLAGFKELKYAVKGEAGERFLIKINDQKGVWIDLNGEWQFDTVETPELYDSDGPAIVLFVDPSKAGTGKKVIVSLLSYCEWDDEKSTQTIQNQPQEEKPDDVEGGYVIDFLDGKVGSPYNNSNWTQEVYNSDWTNTSNQMNCREKNGVRVVNFTSGYGMAHRYTYRNGESLCTANKLTFKAGNYFNPRQPIAIKVILIDTSGVSHYLAGNESEFYSFAATEDLLDQEFVFNTMDVAAIRIVCKGTAQAYQYFYVSAISLNYEEGLVPQENNENNNPQEEDGKINLLADLPASGTDYVSENWKVDQYQSSDWMKLNGEEGWGAISSVQMRSRTRGDVSVANFACGTTPMRYTFSKGTSLGIANTLEFKLANDWNPTADIYIILKVIDVNGNVNFLMGGSSSYDTIPPQELNYYKFELDEAEIKEIVFIMASTIPSTYLYIGDAYLSYNK